MFRFKVGDKVRLSDNVESNRLHGMPGTVMKIAQGITFYPYQVEFENGSTLYFNEGELVDAERGEMTQLDRIEKKLDRMLFRFFGEYMTEDGKFERRVT